MLQLTAPSYDSLYEKMKTNEKSLKGPLDPFGLVVV